MAIVPAPAYPLKHHVPMQMRFNDIDVLGHVNNSIYMQYLDFGKVRYIYDVLGNTFNYHKESLVIVNHDCQYYHIAVFDEPLEVFSRVDQIGVHSITFEQRITNPTTQQVKCICRTVMVGFNIDDDCMIAIPDTWRQLISKYEERDF